MKTSSAQSITSASFAGDDATLAHHHNFQYGESTLLRLRRSAFSLSAIVTLDVGLKDWGAVLYNSRALRLSLLIVFFYQRFDYVFGI
jgi:hypothetical protein